MPTYDYVCAKCDSDFDVIKRVAHLDAAEYCPQCSGPGERRISRVGIINAGDWKPAYNPGLGCVVNSRAHQREILRQREGEGRGLIEVGNEPIEKIHKYYDTQRAESHAKGWAEVDKHIQDAL